MGSAQAGYWRVAGLSSTEPSISIPSISILRLWCIHVPFNGVGSTGLCQILSLHASMSCRTMPDRPHSLTSFFIHSDHIFLGLPQNNVPHLLVPVWYDIFTPYILTPGWKYRTIFSPLGENIVTISSPPLRYFHPPPKKGNIWQTYHL